MSKLNDLKLVSREVSDHPEVEEWAGSLESLIGSDVTRIENNIVRARSDVYYLNTLIKHSGA